MKTTPLKEVYFTEDGIVDGPEVTQCMGIGGHHWTQHPIELYALVSDGEVNEDTAPYHAHFYMSKEKAHANWHRLTPSAKARIRQCTTISFDMPDAWEVWNNAYLKVVYTEANESLNRKPHGWGFTQDELVKHWIADASPESVANLELDQQRYIPYRRWWLNVA